jgi:hypothetical protein
LTDGAQAARAVKQDQELIFTIAQNHYPEIHNTIPTAARDMYSKSLFASIQAFLLKEGIAWVGKFPSASLCHRRRVLLLCSCVLNSYKIKVIPEMPAIFKKFVCQTEEN